MIKECVMNKEEMKQSIEEWYKGMLDSEFQIGGFDSINEYNKENKHKLDEILRFIDEY